MPVYHINSEATEAAHVTLLSQVQQLLSLMSTVDGNINALLADGYQTPEAERSFRPFFEEYKKNYDGVREGLEGIGMYLKSVGDTFTETDGQLGKSLQG